MHIYIIIASSCFLIGFILGLLREQTLASVVKLAVRASLAHLRRENYVALRRELTTLDGYMELRYRDPQS